MYQLLLKNAAILTPEGIAESSDLAIENGRIAKIGKNDGSWQAKRVLDCTNQLAIPGLVNTHTHAAMTLLRSYADDMDLMQWLETKVWPFEAKMHGDDIYWGTMLAIAEMIRSGTTAFVDMYGDMDRVGDAAAETGIRAVLSRGLIGVVPDAQKKLDENVALYKSYHGAADGRITVMFGPHAPYTCPPDYMEKVIREARTLGAEIHMHLSETRGEVDNCIKEFGKTPIAWAADLGLFDLGTLAAHCVHVTDADIEIMKKYNVRVAHNPSSNMKLASGFAPVKKMLEAGLCVGIGTDGASSNNNLDMMEEMHLTSLLHKVHTGDPFAASAPTVVKMATEYGARAAGLGDDLGRLAEGCKADVVLLDMNDPAWHPKFDLVSLLVYASNSSAVRTVLVDGKILMENRELKTIDLERVLREVDRRAAILAK